jgi:N-acetyl-gamma-glutamyl-phosphate reductase
LALPVTPARISCACCSRIPAPIWWRSHRANTPGQTLAQVFPKFSHYPKAKSLRFTEPNAELLAKDAEVVFLGLPHGVAAEFAVAAAAARMQSDRSERGFPGEERRHVYKEFYAHDHPAPDLLAKSVYGLPEAYRNEIKNATLVACPRMLPNEHFVAGSAIVARGVD